MGAVCGKEKADRFSSPGRPLGSAPPQPTSAPVPARKVGGPPRPLGGGAPRPSTADREEQRKRAAAAAEARAKAGNKANGKLGAQLAQQKKQTRIDTLNQLSAEERMHRDADAAAEARANN
ncbi:hypothetical protein SODALDRAFT_194734 [Sodiomyces alkalinus F11]|uniref:Uncharacterized protein n=1 Tax=Sodiomyces alkalinus (strain CBS 110278 / VKM F-3762 / F11) TaxID=1314773 RepID=A0A3N2PSP4_SODAK|nr:hypothetical protein SODALDRAFT_194734 [Sodiomyces alkalinus F11]ROT37346.1 hypothetical protein SODALDRAFT_194734 [Sodiomyces alkalinus F11]